MEIQRDEVDYKSLSEKTDKKHWSVFTAPNLGNFEILKSLGSGNTSKVYLAQSLNDKKTKIAIKIIKNEFLDRNKDNIKSIEQEISILEGLNHDKIVKILDWGSLGMVFKHDGKVIRKLVYIMLEYVPAGLLFDVCQKNGGMGEDAGRFFMH